MSDLIALIISKQEFDLIVAMRSVVSQTNEYEVHVITKNYPGGYVVSEYHDVFLVDDSLFNYPASKEIEVSFSNTLSFEKYIELE